MTESSSDVSRRALLKGAAVSGVSLVVGPSLLSGCANDLTKAPGNLITPIPPVELVNTNQDWFPQRAWSISGNKVLLTNDGKSFPTKTFAQQVYRPTTAQEISGIVKATPATTPIACICGGHESSNACLFTGSDAILLDMANFKSIEFADDTEGMTVTVGAGVVFRELVEALKEQAGALPVGTGPGVGVVGYLVNGGLSGYFSRRLGLLGQRVEKMTVVTATGDIRVLTAKDELLTAMVGAGSALAIVVDVTIRIEHESVIRGADQRVIAFETRAQAIEFSRGATRFMKDRVLPNASVSMELVVTGTKVLVATFIFYDSFRGSSAEFVKPIEDLAASLKLPVVAQAHWASWYEAAAALWPVIAEQKGDPIATMYHCVGTRKTPSDAILSFVSDIFVGEAPLDEATMSIVEIRTLGGAAASGKSIPSGNCHHDFFVDLVTLYDAKGKSMTERQHIVDLTKRVMDKSRAVDGLSIDFSGTHSQPDDPDYCVCAAVIFGTEAMAQFVKATKKQMDPSNRFRFHPFAKLV